MAIFNSYVCLPEGTCTHFDKETGDFEAVTMDM